MSLFENIASTPVMQAVFSDQATVQALLDGQAALAHAGAAAGFFSTDIADQIAAACDAKHIDIQALAADAANTGTIIVPLVARLKALVPAHARFVHFGGTSQDIIDTGLVLQLRAGVALLQTDLETMADAAASLASWYASTPMVGRTLLQPAMPTTFGLKAANWLLAIADSRRAIDHAAGEALCPQCGGAAGTFDALGDKALLFVAAFASHVGLAAPVAPWHTSRAPLARLAAAIAGAVGVAGKIGTDIALMMQGELGEVSEPAAPGRGTSSAMAHKRNPALSIAARAAAARMPGFVASLLVAQDQEHERAAGGWQSEAATWPALMLCASGGLAAMAQAMAGLEVNEAAMAKNLTLIGNAGISPATGWLIEQALNDHRAGKL